ncbi:MAG: 50S ribosomal protein L13 [bacterium]
MKQIIDATGKRPGRLATEIAIILMGKNRTDFAKNRIPDVQVEVTSASEMNIDLNKSKAKEYHSYSGYPGGLKTITMEKLIATKGAKEVLRKAVSGMLPKNKLRAKMLKNLIIKD